jgi:hypothetical protein
MASPWSVLLGALGERLDEDLLPAIYEAASVPTADIRAWLREAGLAHVDPAAGQRPELADIETSAERVITTARTRAAALGAIGGLAGAFAIPPEVLASLVHTLRLAQRLAVLYGFDPETEVGRMTMWRAIAAAYEVEMPTQGPIGLKVRDLPDVLRSQVPATRQASGWLARQVLSRSVLNVANRVTRLVPGLGAGMAAWGAQRRIEGMGKRMVGVYARACTDAAFDIEDEVLAVEVG